MNDSNQVVTATLKALTRERFKQMCKLKRLKQKRISFSSQEIECRKLIKNIQDKIRWELNQHYK